MTDPVPPVLDDSRRTETTVRHYDSSGDLVAETVIVETTRRAPEPDLPVGMYL